ncbi:complex I NDUFA9 subunit family protein [Halomonas sp. SCS19]|uniref:complex I NDUFA9 subunit family protein n=1 Tax=Halomonas sp. SCS19 TaxID=2950870 RepID=UPI0032DFC077
MSDRTRPVVVIGGTGFVGAAVVRELYFAGHAVRVVARHPRLPEEVEEGDPVEAIQADIEDPESLKAALEGASAVINAVSLYRESGKRSFEQVHVEGAARLARLAREAGIDRYVLLSGIGARLDSPSPYVRARARGEQAVMGEIPRAVIVRPSALYGQQSGLVATLARLVKMPLVPLFGAGEMRLQPLHVGDLASALARLATRTSLPRALYELGGPDPLRYRDLVTQVARHLGREPRFIKVPLPLWHALALALSPLPSPPLTRDTLWLISEDNLVANGVGSFADLGLNPRSLRDSLPHCLPTQAG